MSSHLAASAVTFTAEQSLAIRDELNAILRSPCFSGSKRCQDFLEFIIRQALEGNYESLNERFLGVGLFSRPVDYDTGADSIVRVRANDVRRRLAQYYSDHQAASKVTIHLASGSYIPEFQWPPVPSPGAKEIALEHGSGEISVHEEATAVRTSSEPSTVVPTRNRLAVIGLSLAIGLLLGILIGWWTKEWALDRSLNAWKYQPAVRTLWSGFLDNGRETDVVLSDASFQLVENVSGKTFSLDDYLNRSYLDRAGQSLNPALRPVLGLIETKTFGNSSEFRLAQRIIGLGQARTQLRLYNARDFSSSLLTQDDVILIGSGFTNPWEHLFESKLNFIEQSGNASYGLIVNKAPTGHEPSRYVPTSSVGYCVVAYLPNPDYDTSALLIQGSSSEASEAGGDFVLSEEKLDDFMKLLHVQTLPYFEVLLKTSQAHGTPFSATVEAYRTYPGQR